MRKYGKFAALIVVVIGTLVWLATAGMNETKTYYKTISELGQMKDEAYGKRLRVGGDVAAGSIQRVGNEVGRSRRRHGCVAHQCGERLRGEPDHSRAAGHRGRGLGATRRSSPWRRCRARPVSTTFGNGRVRDARGRRYDDDD